MFLSTYTVTLLPTKSSPNDGQPINIQALQQMCEYTPSWSLRFPQRVPVRTWRASVRCPSNGSCFHGQWEDWSSRGLQYWASGFPEEDQGWQWSLTAAWSEWTVSHVGHTCTVEIPFSCILVGHDSTTVYHDLLWLPDSSMSPYYHKPMLDLHSSLSVELDPCPNSCTPSYQFCRNL